jgi:CHAD domain-containing protein
VRTTLERELKLDADAGFALPDLGGATLAPRTFTSTYYDTADRRLLRSGITLRRRVENRAGLWQLKLPSENGRYELEQPGGPAYPPEPFLRLLPALLRGGAELEQAAKLRTRRSGVTVSEGEERVDVVLDAVAVLEAGRVASSFVEVEAEVTAGSGAMLARVGRSLRKAGARPGDGAPKLRRVLGLPTPAPRPGSVEPGARLRELLLDQYEAMLANDPGVRLGEDAEALHQLRVATRRSRALLRAARGLVAPEWAEPLRLELAWLGGLLGPVRDLDVLLEHLDAEAADLEGGDARAFGRLRARLAADRARAREALLEAMASGRYLRLLDTLEHAGDAPVVAGETSLADLAAQAFARLRKAVRTLPGRPSDDQLHRVRIETKRARYAAELGEPALKKAGRRFVRRAKTVQDVIGEHQDACIAEARIRELALRAGSSTALVAGRLVERQRLRKQTARGAFPDAWRALDKAGRAAF